MADPGEPPPQLTPEEEQRKRLDEEREITRSYKRVFSTDSGLVVLADLNEKFGRHKAEYQYGCTAMDLAYRTGLKQFALHIDNQLKAVLRPLGQKPPKRKARS